MMFDICALILAVDFAHLAEDVRVVEAPVWMYSILLLWPTALSDCVLRNRHRADPVLPDRQPAGCSPDGGAAAEIAAGTFEVGTNGSMPSARFQVGSMRHWLSSMTPVYGVGRYSISKRRLKQ